MELGRKFADKIGTRLEEADLMLTGGNKLRLAELRSGNVIPEGEPLIMRGLTEESRLPLRNEIYAIASGGKLMISLGSFFSAVDFAIGVSPAKGTAAGWFGREDQTFSLDVGKAEVAVLGETQKLNLDDVMVEEEHILVSSMLVEKWFGLEINMDLSDLALRVRSGQPLPIEKLDERRRRTQYAAAWTESRLPLQEEPRRMFTKPYLDVAIDAGTRGNGGGNAVKNMNWSVIGSGDLAGFTAQTFVSGGLSDDPAAENRIVDTVRQIFTREDPEGRMLGPLHARRISFGDVTAVQQPFVNSPGQGQGIRVSNMMSDSFTTLSAIDVRGDAQPGWDVELYQNDSLVGLQTVTNEGQYNFESVFLFAGRNDMRLVFYGPQGEVREEAREIYSGATDGLGGWDVAVSRANTSLWPLGNEAETPIDGDPQFSARYEHNLGVLGTAKFGLIDNSITDGILSERQTFVQAGLSSVLYDTLLSIDGAHEARDGAWAANVTARRNFGRHMTGLSFQHSSANFSPGSLGPEPARDRAQLRMSGPLGTSFAQFSRPNYTLSGAYTSTSAGATSVGGSLGLGGRLKSLGLGLGLSYNVTETTLPGGGQTRTPPGNRLSGSTTASGTLGRDRWRLTTNYDLSPLKPVSYTGRYTHSFSRNIEGVADVDREVGSGLTRADLSLNWLAERFTLSPRLSVDTDRNFAFNTSLRFSMAPDPYTGDYDIFRRSVSSSGGVAGRVFLDANGDGILNANEQLLQDAEIKIAQSNRTAVTNAKGVGFMPDVGRGEKTDIELNIHSLPDPYYVTMDPGSAIMPRPGVVSKIDFPVVVGSDMDGQAEYVSEDGGRRIARSLAVALVAPDGTVEKSVEAGFDGYWSMEGIRPGVYYLIANPGPSSPPGHAVPRLVVFGPEGNTLYGQSLSLEAGHNIPFRFSSENAPPTGARRSRVIRQDDIAAQDIFIDLGDYRSRLGLTLAWYRFRLQANPWNNYLSLVTPLSDIAPDPATARLSLPLKSREPLTVTTAAAVCESLSELGFPCGVSVVTRYRELAPSAELSEKSAKKGKS